MGWPWVAAVAFSLVESSISSATLSVFACSSAAAETFSLDESSISSATLSVFAFSSAAAETSSLDESNISAAAASSPFTGFGLDLSVLFFPFFFFGAFLPFPFLSSGVFFFSAAAAAALAFFAAAAVRHFKLQTLDHKIPGVTLN